MGILDRRRVAALLLLAAASMGLGCGGGGGTTTACADGVFPAGVERGPQVALVTPTSAVIAWRTHEVLLGSVEYGPTAAYGSVAIDPLETAEHVLDLSGLAPGSTVHYRIVHDGNAVTGDLAFRTAPVDPETLVRFAVLGDSGTSSPAQYAVAAVLAAADPDAVLHTGDVIYDHGNAIQVLCHYFVPYADVLPHAPVYPTLGNHDLVADDGQALLTQLYLPTNSVDGSERYYSFDRGSCHVTVLDGYSPLDPGTPQGDWLAADLVASSARWKLVVEHRPLWSHGAHGGSGRLQRALAPVFEANGVDLVLSGDDHHYERSHPMVGETPIDLASGPDYGDTPGVIYVVSGGGGADLHGTGSGPSTAYSEGVHHLVLIEAEGPTLSWRAIRTDGTVADAASITKP